MVDGGHRYVVRLDGIDRTQHSLVGGKAAGLGDLCRLEGVRVPPGVCVTTAAFERAVTATPGIDELLGRLSSLDPGDDDARRSTSAALRQLLEQTPVPGEVAVALEHELDRLGAEGPWAVRSSATTEDLPTASFAGQHDTGLHVLGATSVLAHVRRCWASLFNDRAVIDRERHGLDHRSVRMAVVVQRMVEPTVSGVLFTADPATSNRRTCVVGATFGLGEALVSGRVDADTYRVRDGEVIERSIGAKQLELRPRSGGGTDEVATEAGRRTRATLGDDQVLELARLGRRIESASGGPQDIEWCLAADGIWVVQSRPITTLFPVPTVDDDGLHVYISVAHQQMMTDPMRPLGWSMFQRAAGPPMHEAGGRLFVDVTAHLSAATMRERLLAGFATSDPLIGDALRTIVDRGVVPLAEPPGPGDGAPSGRGLPGGEPTELDADPTIVAELIERSSASIEALERSIAGLTGPALFDAIESDLPELKARLADPESYRVIMAGTEATWWLNDTMAEWLGVPDAADVLTRSVPDNVTSQMGLALLDVADVVRERPEVVTLLERVERQGAADDDLLTELVRVEGGHVVRAAIERFLEQYGMRCVGEIDLTRPRWSEQPDTLVPLLLGHVRNAEPGAGARRFEQGRIQAEAWAAELLARVRASPDGDTKAERTQAMIDRVRTFAGYREHPKYGLIRRFWIYKQALWAEAERMVAAGALRTVDDTTWLTFDELARVARSGRADHELIERRRAAFRTYEQLTPPRVMTSEGEVVTGTYRRDDLPEGALAGLGVSAGTVEGCARVLHDLSDAEVGPGDVLVTTFTDPSWSPLFVAVAALVTEVGGLMTHGAVIAREYGLPAVVGVEHATELIRDGQRIRVHGAQGYVELLD